MAVAATCGVVHRGSLPGDDPSGPPAQAALLPRTDCRLGLTDCSPRGTSTTFDAAPQQVRLSGNGSFGVHVAVTRCAAPSLRNELRRWLSSHKLPEHVVFDVLLATNEAYCNAVLHSGTSTPIEVEASFEDGDLLLRIADAGRGFSPWTAGCAEERHPFSTRGRGLQLMRLLMSEVHIDSSPHGTVICMVRRT